MALSFIEYVGNGTQTDFAFSFPYISPSHIVLTVDGVVTPFTFFSSSTARVTPAPANGTTVRISRITPDTPLVNFVDGSTLTEADLDVSTLQAIYLAQEAVDKSAVSAGSVTASQITDASANARQLITAANFAAMKTLLAISAADITNASANGRSLITAADYAAMRALLGFTTTNITDMSANGRSLVTAASYAAMKTLLAIGSADITDASANGRSLITAANYAAMKTLLAITAADITNASADGRSLITATNYAAMRTALGLTAPATAAFATNAQATAGLDNTTVMTPLRTAEAIAALAPGGGGGGSAAVVTFSPVGNIAATNVQAAIQELDTEKAAVSHTHTAADISNASADGRSLITSASYAAMRTALGLTAPATASFASNAQAVAGTDNTTVMTPLRTAEAIAALGGGGGGTTIPAGTLIRSTENPGTGWTEADGTWASRTGLSALFSAIGTRFGAADGTNFFVKPRIASRINLFRNGTSLPAGRAWHSMIALADGRLMIVGGNSGTEAAPVMTNTVYFGSIADDMTITWTTGTAYPISAAGIMITQLADGRVVGVGGMTGASTSVSDVYFGTISGDTITWVAGTAYPTTIGAGMIFRTPDERIWVGGGFDTANTNATRFGTISGNTITWVSGTALPFTGANMSYARNNADVTKAQYMYASSAGTARIIGFTNGSNTVTYTGTSTTSATLTSGNGLTHLPCGTFMYFQNNVVQTFWIDPNTIASNVTTALAPASSVPYSLSTGARHATIYVPQRNCIVVCGGLNGGSALSNVAIYYAIERAFLKT